MNKDLKIIFAPGAFDEFEGTQEELDDLMDQICQSIRDGDFFEKSTPVEEDDEIWELINSRPKTKQ